MALNYLGYTWIDQNRNLRKGMAMIEKAVRLKPDDGYIVDSLGLGVLSARQLPGRREVPEQAVVLRPEDPVLNDHLGDAYWRVGREREARFQCGPGLELEPRAPRGREDKAEAAEGPQATPARQAKRGKVVREPRRAQEPQRGQASNQ